MSTDATAVVFKHWQVAAWVLAAVFAFGIGYAENNQRDNQQDDTLAEHTEELEKHNVQQQQDAVDRERIKVNQEYMREEIDSIGDKLDQVLDELRQ